MGWTAGEPDTTVSTEAVVARAKQLQHERDAVIAQIRNWHRPVTAGANHYDGGLRRHCSECRHPWPCRTYQLTEQGNR